TIKIGDFYNSIFLTPGDTFDIHTTTTSVWELKPYPRNVPEYFNISGTNQDAVDISLLLRDVDSRLLSDNYGWKRIKKVIEGGLDSVMVANADIKNIMSGFVCNAPGEIDRYPVSPYAKDMLYTYALVNNYLPMEDIAMYWRDKRALTQGEGADRRRVSNPDYKEIDTDIYYGGQQEYASLLYDNPLVLCENGSFINRCKFSQLFGPFRVMSSGTLHIEPIDGGIVVDSLSVFEEGESRYGRIKAYEKDWLGKMDLMDCFMEQLLVAGELSDKITGYRELTPDWLATTSVYVSELLPLVNHKMLISTVLDSWGKTNREAGRMESGASEGNFRSVDTQSNILAEVIKPYLGNVIYVDVWGIGCGPCRAAMLQQKELIRHYEGQPLTVIYLAGEDEKEQCERWMRENDIKGEHVYLSPDNKERFYGDFNIVGIPFGILIDKKGNVVDTKLHSIYIRDSKLESLLNE
ncbi:MAG: TlpA family protein disulfide reductase, partial [Muribaculaceae bacterium]|nr:TlpA family protein disulfide reductase [Muribaculaceae bacterium]